MNGEMRGRSHRGLGGCTRAGSGGKCSQGGRGSAWGVGWSTLGSDLVHLEGESTGDRPRTSSYVKMVTCLYSSGCLCLLEYKSKL
jgi:hypothetical protein